MILNIFEDVYIQELFKMLLALQFLTKGTQKNNRLHISQ